VELILAVIWVRTVKPSHFPAIISQAYDDDDEVGVWQCCSSAYLSYLFINNLMARWFALPLSLVIVTRADHHGLGLYITLLQV